MMLSMKWLVFGALASFHEVVAKPANILFIMTDDQDLHMQSVDHMQHTKRLIVDEGTTFAQHFCTVALCCPSRATLWTGRAAHNHNVTSVAPPYGGYPKVVQQGINDDNLFLWMQEAGYNTYYVGKLWNFHSVDNYDRPFAKGFSGSDFLLDPYTYQYYNGKISHNGEQPVSIAGQYSTDVVAERAMSWLKEAIKQPEPFFLTVSPIAPHSNWVIEPENNRSYLLEPKSAERHQNLFSDYKIPRDESFNAAINGAVSWIAGLPELNDTLLDYHDHYQRQRLRALQSVDEMVQSLIEELEAAGQLENTYIFYTTDNGYHLSQHRMNPGKECAYDTDVHIPFFVRGPNVEKGAVVSSVTTHTDVSSTLLKIAGREKQLDGMAMPLRAQDRAEHRNEHASLEYWGPAVPEGFYGGRTDLNREAGDWHNIYMNSTYKALRVISEGYNLFYSIWCTNETELYDLTQDKHQLHNLLVDDQRIFSLYGRPRDQVISRLNALIMVLKNCKDKTCTNPWTELHPQGSVTNLAEALVKEFDGFYAEQPQMWFQECGLGYFAEFENQSPVKAHYDMGHGPGLVQQVFDYTNHWHLLT